MEKINILLVDDRPENLTALEALVVRNDVNVVSTTSASEALRLSLEMDISIAIVDVQMPEMNGFEFVNILKEDSRTKDILIIFVTALSKRPECAVKGLKLGAVDFLYKPLNPYVTSAKVNSFIQIIRHQQALKKKNKELLAYQKRLIRSKEEAEKGKNIKENFLANMSHEIRTPINGIIGITNLLNKTSLTDDQKEMIRLLAISSESLLGVVNDILDISKIEQGKFRIFKTETDLVKNCTAVFDLLKIQALEKSLDLKMELENNLPHYIMADSLRLNQILINLISNAIKFTSSGKVELKVSICNKRGNDIQIKFSVCDTGHGISNENLNKVFDTFEQGDAQTTVNCEGVGLGLSLIKKLVQLKGGELNVESKMNEGSCFSYTNWYRIAKPKEEKLSIVPEERKIIENVRILVAEDNAVNAFVIKNILKQWNIDFKVVENGIEALEALKESDYHLILMDTFMPEMNGLEATRLIRKGYVLGKENIPIISFSSSVKEEDKTAALTAGANDVMSKPFEVDLLYKKLCSYLTRQEPIF